MPAPAASPSDSPTSELPRSMPAPRKHEHERKRRVLLVDVDGVFSRRVGPFGVLHALGAYCRSLCPTCLEPGFWRIYPNGTQYPRDRRRRQSLSTSGVLGPSPSISAPIKQDVDTV